MVELRLRQQKKMNVPFLIINKLQDFIWITKNIDI
jgi:hypothetical protein